MAMIFERWEVGFFERRGLFFWFLF